MREEKERFLNTTQRSVRISRPYLIPVDDADCHSIVEGILNRFLSRDLANVRLLRSRSVLVCDIVQTEILNEIVVHHRALLLFRFRSFGEE